MAYDESVFAVTAKPVELNVEILELTIERFLALTEGEQNYLRMTSASVSGLRELPPLRRRIAEYVHMRGLQNLPTRLVDINRRFSRPCAAIGTTPFAEVRHLCSVNVLMALDKRKQVVYFSRALWKAMQVKREAEPAEFELIPPYLDQLFDNLAYEEQQ